MSSLPFLFYFPLSFIWIEIFYICYDFPDAEYSEMKERGKPISPISLMSHATNSHSLS
jgi:hypothetical protein